VKGPWERLVVKAFAYPIVTEFSLRVAADGTVTDLGAAVGARRLKACDDCGDNGVEVDLSVENLRSFAKAKRVAAHILGFALELSAEERAGLRRFAAEIGAEPH
jgi:hypothetical protein